MEGTRTRSIKEEVLEMIQALPDDCTLADVKYRIALREKVAEGIADVEAGRVLTQGEVEQEVASGLKSSERSPH